MAKRIVLWDPSTYEVGVGGALIASPTLQVLVSPTLITTGKRL